MKDNGLSHSQISKNLGKSRTTILKYLAVFELSGLKNKELLASCSKNLYPFLRLKTQSFPGIKKPFITIYMPTDYKAGEKLFIEYARKKLHIIDPQPGEIKAVEFFADSHNFCINLLYCFLFQTCFLIEVDVLQNPWHIDIFPLQFGLPPLLVKLDGIVGKVDTMWLSCNYFGYK